MIKSYLHKSLDRPLATSLVISIGIILVILALPLLVLLAQKQQETRQRAAAGSFLSRSGTQFIKNGKPIRLIGYQIKSPYTIYTDTDLKKVFDEIQIKSKGNMVRIWFYESAYVKNGWTDLDRIISNARSHNMYIAVALVNQWGSWEAKVNGKDNLKYLSWFQSGYKTTNDGYPLSFRDWAVKIAAHYANEPAIGIWQIINEPIASNPDGTCSEAAAAAAMRSFADDVAGAIKAVDPNHLISLGDGGGPDCGTKDTDYVTVHASNNIDICEAHIYGSDTAPIHPNAMLRLSQCGPKGLNKPLLAGEFGIYADIDAKANRTGTVTQATLQQRATFYDQKMNALFQAGLGGLLTWQFDLTCCQNTTDIGPGDPVEAVVAKYAQTVIPSPSGGTTLPTISYVFPTWVCAGSSNCVGSPTPTIFAIPTLAHPSIQPPTTPHPSGAGNTNNSLSGLLQQLINWLLQLINQLLSLLGV